MLRSPDLYDDRPMHDDDMTPNVFLNGCRTPATDLGAVDVRIFSVGCWNKLWLAIAGDASKLG